MIVPTVLGALALLASGIAGEQHASRPEVRLGATTVRGSWMTSYKGRRFAAFRGIPYAKPPVGRLRFRNPQPTELEVGLLDAVSDGPRCIMQNVFEYPSPDVIGQEDCLYLNVYCHPEKRGLPVLVYVHGVTGWLTGTGISSYSSPEYLMQHDVVLVTFNYRLGVFGFLTTETEDAPGNQGQKDQVVVLRWVRKYIAAFGGDPDCVTLFGQSSGSVSAHFHMLSPMSTGLFHRVIGMSGTSLTAVATPRENPGLVARRHAALVGCNPHASTRRLLACLRTVNATLLVNTTAGLKDWWEEPYAIYPVVVEKWGDSRDRFLPKSPLQFLKEAISNPGSAHFTKIPWITGCTSEEGIFRSITVLKTPTVLEDFNSRVDELMPLIMELSLSAGNRSAEVWRRIKHYYFPHKRHVILDESTAYDFTYLHTERACGHPMHNSVLYQKMAGQKDIFVYQFKYRGKFSWTSKFANTTNDYGVCHCDDLQYIVPTPSEFPEVAAERPKWEWEIVDSMVDLWVNFAKHGRPTEQPAGPRPKDECAESVEGVWWPRVWGDREVNFLEIAAGSRSRYNPKGGVLKFCMRDNFLGPEMAFWDSLPMVENSLHYHH